MFGGACALAFTSCFGVGVVVLSAQDDTFHWAFAPENKKTNMVSFDEECSHYEAVVYAVGQDTPFVSERMAPPSGRVPASGVVEVSSPLQL